ncbi:MAG: hypothetical protein AABM40_14355, partial [Chloroflexota bacterium]
VAGLGVTVGVGEGDAAVGAGVGLGVAVMGGGGLDVGVGFTVGLGITLVEGAGVGVAVLEVGNTSNPAVTSTVLPRPEGAPVLAVLLAPTTCVPETATGTMNDVSKAPFPVTFMDGMPALPPSQMS